MMSRHAAIRLRRLHAELKELREPTHAHGAGAGGEAAPPQNDGIAQVVLDEDFSGLFGSPHASHGGVGHDTANLIHAVIEGPADTPYEGLRLSLIISIPERYPMEPPRMQFVDAVFHPNISLATGAICVSFLKRHGEHAWSAGTSLRSALIALVSLLGDAAPDDPLNATAASMWRAAKHTGSWDRFRHHVLANLARQGHGQAAAELRGNAGQ